MKSDEEIRKLAEFAWDEDIKTNPSTPNPYSFVYGFRKGYKEAMEEYKSVPIVDDGYDKGYKEGFEKGREFEKNHLK